MTERPGLIVREVALRDFRSYHRLELALRPGVVLLAGPNGAGKTNLLEALHVGTQGFSPRTRTDAQMVRFGADAGRIDLRGMVGESRFEVDLVLRSREGRRARLNGAELRSAEQLRSELRTLVFTPDRLAVVKGGPAARRAYLDRTSGRLFPGRAHLATEYAAALAQRNAALRRIAAGLSPPAALAPWTEAVVHTGTALVEARSSAIELLAPGFERCASRLGLADAALRYEGDPPTAAALEQRLARDLERGITGEGPHLHEIRIGTTGRELRLFGSQGEQRSAVLALVLAEAELLADRSGGSPLVLLDDVLSELDEQRRRALAEMVASAAQVVVTATSAAMLPVEPAQLVAVSPGCAEDVSVS